MKNESQDIIVEFAQTGNIVKVTAICPVTYVEAFIIGDPNASREYLTNLATKRLISKIKKRKEQVKSKNNNFYA